MKAAFQIAVISCIGFCLLGCTKPEKGPLIEGIKITDLAPASDGNEPKVKLLETINFDIHIFEIPADNISKLADIRRLLGTKDLRFNNHIAFSDNSFSAYTGQNRNWLTINQMLQIAGGQRINRISILLSEGQTETMPIAPIGQTRMVDFTSSRGRESALVGPGALALRLQVKIEPSKKGLCSVTAYPVFTPLLSNTIPPLDEMAKAREFIFTSAAFGLDMKPGDFVVLAPGNPVTDSSELGGLFFTNYAGSLFMDENSRRPAELKQAVRVFLIVYVGSSY
jgi:hypothetical protein